MALNKNHSLYLVSAFVVHGGTQIALLLWQPQQEPVYIFYIVAGLWGIGDAVIQTQVNGKHTHTYILVELLTITV